MFNVIRKYFKQGKTPWDEEEAVILTPEAQYVVDMDLDDPERLRLSEVVLHEYIKGEQSHEREFDLKSRYAEKVDECREKNYKAAIVFHGGCLGCKVTKIMGISECHSCYYYNWVTDNPAFKHDSKDFPNKGKEEYISEAFRDRYPEYFI